MRVKIVVIAVALCVAAVAFAFAQSVPPPPPPALPTPSAQSAVHVTTRIVQVSVTVHDDRGRPVTGLTKDDFILLDEGQRQQIASITEQTNRVSTTAATSAPNLFTNRFEKGATQPTLTVIVIDAYNMRYWDTYPHQCGGRCPPQCIVGSMFGQVEKFISHMQPQDRVALYELARNLYILQDFTSDTAALQRGLDRGKEYSNSLHFARSQIEVADMDAQTMGAMQAIGNRLANVPGRKNFIWLSTGFPPDAGLGKGAVSATEKMDKTEKTLANADFPLLAIDTFGLVSGGMIFEGGGGGGGGGLSSGVDLPTPAMSADDQGLCGRRPLMSDFWYTKDVADTSGGRAFYDTNDFAGAIRKAIDDSAQTYILNYYPDHNKWNGEFREIKVKVNRPGLSGLEVRARKGYYAVADTASATEHDSQKLADAIKSPLESTDLGFDVQADGFDVAGVRQLKVKITLDANQLRFQQQDERRTDSLAETWVELNAQGEQVGEISKTIELNHSQDEYKKLLQDGFTYSKTLVLAKDAAEVRLVLRDAGNGAIGSVIIPLARLFAAAEPQTKK